MTTFLPPAATPTAFPAGPVFPVQPGVGAATSPPTSSAGRDPAGASALSKTQRAAAAGSISGGNAFVSVDRRVTKMVALGDVHSKWHTVQRIFDHEFPSGSGSAIAVGDFGTSPHLTGNHRIHFVHGNHDSSQMIARMREEPDHPDGRISPLFAGEFSHVGTLRVAGIPGVYSPYFYQRPDDAPLKYFTNLQVETMLRMQRSVDILLMHEAPSGVGFMKDGEDLGNPVLANIISHLKPSLVFFGHHHMRFLGKLGGTHVIGLDYPHRSYVVIEHDAASGTYTVTEKYASLASDPKERIKGYQYPWESGIQTPHAERLLIQERIAVGREQDIALMLRAEHFERIHCDMQARILESLRSKASLQGEDLEQLADIRAGISLNQAISYAAKYAAKLEAEPTFGLQQRGDLMDSIYDEMCGELPAEASREVLYAFQECLKALGLVWSRKDTPAPQR
jgi:Icc-related predicted phosphoesterase